MSDLLEACEVSPLGEIAAGTAIRDEIREYVLASFYISDPAELDDDVSLLASGFIDSTGMLDLILFLEDRYSIRVGGAETTPENLETISRIAAYVSRKLSVEVAG
jgi:acyl carrier protein